MPVDKLNRYLVFRGADYYPAGGWDDFVGSYEFIFEARAAVDADKQDWSHIVDKATGRPIADDAVDPPGEDIDLEMYLLAEIDREPPLSPGRVAELRAKLAEVRPKPKGLDAAVVARAFEVMLPVSTGGLTIDRNPHIDCSAIEDGEFQPVSAAAYIKGEALSYIGPLEQQKIEATNELWILRWRMSGEDEDTKLAAASLPAIAQWLQDNGLAFGS